MIRLLEIETQIVQHLIQDSLNPFEQQIEAIAETVRTSIRNQQMEIEEVDLEELTKDKVGAVEEYVFAVLEDNTNEELMNLQFIQLAIAQNISGTPQKKSFLN